MYAKDGTILDKRELLRARLKSLAIEARLLRCEERRTNGEIRAGLYWQRMVVVRQQARHAHIAYGLIKGRSIEQMEAKSASQPDCGRSRSVAATRQAVTIEHLSAATAKLSQSR